MPPSKAAKPIKSMGDSYWIFFFFQLLFCFECKINNRIRIVGIMWRGSEWQWRGRKRQPQICYGSLAGKIVGGGGFGGHIVEAALRVVVTAVAPAAEAVVHRWIVVEWLEWDSGVGEATRSGGRWGRRRVIKVIVYRK